MMVIYRNILGFAILCLSSGALVASEPIALAQSQSACLALLGGEVSARRALTVSDWSQSLSGLNGFGSDYGKIQPQEKTFTASDIAIFKKLESAVNSKDHHFIFNDMELIPFESGERPVASNGVSGAMRFYKFKSPAGNGFTVIVELNETLIGGSRFMTVTVGFSNDQEGTKTSGNILLGHSGTNTQRRLDKKMNLVFEGIQYRFSSSMFTTIHAPEEYSGRKRTQRWSSFGAGGFSVVFTTDNNNPEYFSATMSGYLVKR